MSNRCPIVDDSAARTRAMVGDRYQLVARQRVAVARSSCSDAAFAARRTRCLAPGQLHGAALRVDGFNACITLEAALSGGLVLVGRDGAHRDLASVHGNDRRVSETPPALELQPARVTWYFDRPVSNSGTLAGLLRRSLAARGSDAECCSANAWTQSSAPRVAWPCRRTAE